MSRSNDKKSDRGASKAFSAPLRATHVTSRSSDSSFDAPSIAGALERIRGAPTTLSISQRRI